MQERVLGSSGIKVTPVGLGCMGLTHASGDPLPKREAVRILQSAYELGYRFFDTAACYTGINPDGTTAYNEEAVGEAFSGLREHVVIATKFGVRHAPDRSLILDSRPDSIRRELESSLKKLKTDTIDLYYQHRIDPNVAPEEVAGVMADLIREGLIRCWGISEVNEKYLRRAHAVCPVSAIQNRYSMMARWHERLFPVLEELNIAYVAFSPLANGALSGCYDEHTAFEGKADYRVGMPQYTKEGVQRAHALQSLLLELAEEKGATPAQIALAWVLAKKPYLIPIPGSRKPERLKENWLAASLRLDARDTQRIQACLDESHFLVFGGH